MAVVLLPGSPSPPAGVSTKLACRAVPFGRSSACWWLCAGRAAVDNDRLALYISDLMLPLVEAVTGRKMQTGFVKTAIYSEGAFLPVHRDQARRHLQTTHHTYTP